MRFLRPTLAKIVATAVGMLVLIGGGAFAFVRAAFIYAERGVSKEKYDGMVQGVSSSGSAAPSARIASGAHAQ